MATRPWRAALIGLFALALGGPLAAEEREYAPGQIWAFDAAPEDAAARIQIREIGTTGPADAPITVYHISMIGLTVPGDEATLDVGHLPVSRQTLDQSVTTLVTEPLTFPEYKEGIAEWEAAEGGVFTIRLREIADILREQMAQMRRGDHHGTR